MTSPLHKLPDCCRICSTDSSELLHPVVLNRAYQTNDEGTIDMIQSLFEQLVGADCWAVVVDEDKVLFNSYREDFMHPAERIDESIRRDALIHNAHRSLFMFVYRANVSTTIDVYIIHTMKVRFTYDGPSATWTLSTFESV